MKVALPINTYNKEEIKNPQREYIKKREAGPSNDTIKGVLLKNHIEKDMYERIDNFDKISTQLLIPDNCKIKVPVTSEEKESFDYKKALKPFSLACIGGLGLIGLISVVTKKYSNILANKDDLVRPGDLARNINIVEEPHFAMYRMLRDPKAKNVAGFVGVMLMSMVTVIAKNFVDGVKEIWVKKQNYDIERDLQEKLIQVETDSLSGKLNVVNVLLSDSAKYFKAILKEDKTKKTSFEFENFLSFQGKADENKNQNENKRDLKAILAVSTGVLGFVGLSYGLFRNYQKTLKNLEIFTQKYEHNEIQSKMNKAVSNTNKKVALKELIDLFKVVNATDETMKTNFSKISNISQDEINKAIKEVKSAQIYAQAPEALGGISEKIQYYCYINEDRGHLYNWILNPENKFNKYLFLCFSAITSVSYIGKQIAQAIKDVVVARENSKNELVMKKQLVNIEINNFKAKKMSAIEPLMNNFMLQVERGKSTEDLKNIAENILVEIKNGPPYVYS